MSTPEIREVKVCGNKLICPVCKNEKFWNRTTLMNTSGMTAMGMDWLNKEADNYICTKCGYVFWFFETSPSDFFGAFKDSGQQDDNNDQDDSNEGINKKPLSTDLIFNI